MYSIELADVMKKFLDTVGVIYEFDEEDGGIVFRINQSDKIESMIFCIDIEADFYNMYAILDNLVITDSNSNLASELVHRLNTITHISRFEFDFENKLVMCTQALNCNGIIPNIDFIEETFSDIISCVNEFAYCFVEAIERKKTPKEIVDNCEKEMFL